MKNVCSIKTIAILFLVLFAFMGLHKAYSGQLNFEEEAVLNQWLAEPSSRPELLKEYWAEMRSDIENFQNKLPLKLSEVIYFTGLELDHNNLLTYSYLASTLDIKTEMVRRDLIKFLCQDPQSILFLSTFKGKLYYEYFFVMAPQKPFDTFSIDINDCRAGGSI